MTDKESPFACDMTAIAPEQRDAHLATIKRLFLLVQGQREVVLELNSPATLCFLEHQRAFHVSCLSCGLTFYDHVGNVH